MPATKEQVVAVDKYIAMYRWLRCTWTYIIETIERNVHIQGLKNHLMRSDVALLKTNNRSKNTQKCVWTFRAHPAKLHVPKEDKRDKLPTFRATLGRSKEAMDLEITGFRTHSDRRKI